MTEHRERDKAFLAQRTSLIAATLEMVAHYLDMGEEVLHTRPGPTRVRARAEHIEAFDIAGVLPTCSCCTHTAHATLLLALRALDQQHYLRTLDSTTLTMIDVDLHHLIATLRTAANPAALDLDALAQSMHATLRDARLAPQERDEVLVRQVGALPYTCDLDLQLRLSPLVARRRPARHSGEVRLTTATLAHAVLTEAPDSQVLVLDEPMTAAQRDLFASSFPWGVDADLGAHLAAVRAATT